MSIPSISASEKMVETQHLVSFMNQVATEYWVTAYKIDLHISSVLSTSLATLQSNNGSSSYTGKV